jgi:hypothetical protein
MVKREFEFNKNEKGEWYLDLPEWKGDPEELQMVEGADEWLELLSDGARIVNLLLADEKIENAAMLTLLHVREPNLGGGGDYYLETYQGEKIGLKLWLCEVTRFVFDDLPQRIYFLKK